MIFPRSSPFVPVALMAVVALYFVDYLKGKTETAFSSFFFSSLPPLLSHIPISHMASLHLSLFSTIRLARPLICCVSSFCRRRRRFEPVGRSPSCSPTRSHSKFRVSCFGFLLSALAVRQASEKCN